MNEILNLTPTLAMGILIGLIFFGGLWWTVRNVFSSRHPALLIFGSLLLRTSVTLGGFYFFARGHWERLLACLAGFVIARLIVTWLTRTAGKPYVPAREVGHAA